VCDESTNVALEVPVTYRDFRTDHIDFGWDENFADGTVGSSPLCSGANGQVCPDRPRWFRNLPTTGMVASTLGGNGKPVCNNPQEMLQSCTTLNNEWYADVPGTNIRFEGSLTLTPIGGGISEFTSFNYFPLDGMGYADPSLTTPDNNCDKYVGPGLSLVPAECPNAIGGPGTLHNYFYTSEIHIQFSYLGGETFSFEGDDDVWVFINNQLAIDVGGVHPAAAASVNLDSLGLTLGQTYDLDIFHAERQVTDSNFKMTTSITVSQCPPGTVPSCWPSCPSTSAIDDTPRTPAAADASSSVAAASLVTSVNSNSATSVTIGAVATLLALGLYKKRRHDQQLGTGRVVALPQAELEPTIERGRANPRPQVRGSLTSITEVSHGHTKVDCDDDYESDVHTVV